MKQIIVRTDGDLWNMISNALGEVAFAKRKLRLGDKAIPPPTYVMTENPATRHFKERAKIGLALSEPTEIRQALFNHDNARANRKRVNIITRQLPALDGRRNLTRNDTTPSRSKMTNIPISTNRKPINVIYLKKFFIHFHTLLISKYIFAIITPRNRKPTSRPNSSSKFDILKL